MSNSSSAVLELEKELLTRATRGNLGRLDELLADDFLEFGKSGMRFGKKIVLEHLPNEAAFECKMEREELRELSYGVVLVTYHLTVTVLGSGAISKTWRSSLWKYLDGGWKMVFHQGTLASGVER